MIHLKKCSIAFSIFAIFIFFAACKNNNQPETRNIQLLTDSSAYQNNTSSDTSRMTQTNVTAPKEKENVQPEHVKPAGTHKANPETATSDHSGSASNQGTSTSDNSESASNSGTVSNSGETSAPETKKKVWSKAAQGAVIGGVGGAVGGAIISKKKGAGAAIGGAIGAAGGYIIGREKDKKDGRVKK